MIRYDDDESRYGSEVRFTGDVEVTDAEFVRVRCYSNSSDRPFYTDFHAVARLKPDVEHRCDEAMKQRRRTDDVFDVLMIGIDSTSRLNSIRRLNSTRQFLLQQLHVRFIVSRYSLFLTRVDLFSEQLVVMGESPEKKTIRFDTTNLQCLLTE